MPPRQPRVLVTGATGLLGRQLLRRLCHEDKLNRCCWEVRGLCRDRPKLAPGLVACDLAIEGVPAAQIEAFRPDIVVHLASEWRPDVLRRNPARARRLNVDASGAVAAACGRLGAWLLFISVDFVFDGTSPPYKTDDHPNPLSEFGWHKLHGEQLTLAGCPGAAVLRVPLLYGPFQSLADSAVTSLYTELKCGVKEVDAWQLCHPTWACDVAGVIEAMLELHVKGERLSGIFHWSSDESFTWHEMMLLVGEVCGIDTSGIRGVSAPPLTPLPRDTRLDCSRLERLIDTLQFQTRFQVGLRACLKAFGRGPSLVSAALPDAPDASREALPCAEGRERVQRQQQQEEEQRTSGSALQELFWQELERTRSRLREAGFVGSSGPMAKPSGGTAASSPSASTGALAARVAQQRRHLLEILQSNNDAKEETIGHRAEMTRARTPRHVASVGVLDWRHEQRV